MAEFDADYQALRWVAVPLILVATTFMLRNESTCFGQSVQS